MKYIDGSHWIVAVILAAVAMLVGVVYGAVKRESARQILMRGAEMLATTFAGAVLARSFIFLLLWLGDQSAGAGLAIGWAFFLWPGAIDTVLAPFGIQAMTSAGGLLWCATVIGAAAGMMDGLWRIHDWKGLGWLSFPLDVTWGLAGTTNGVLFHLVNFAWAGHDPETRKGAHRYQRGFRFKSGFAVTQGSVMSNLNTGPGTGLFDHERTHAWQNRAFGPAFTLTYLAWMVVWFIPALIAAAVKKSGLQQGIEGYCYYNNPWETWAYLVGAGPRTGRGPHIWSDAAVLAWAIPFFILATGLMLVVVVVAW